jgi:hypothetical protein
MGALRVRPPSSNEANARLPLETAGAATAARLLALLQAARTAGLRDPPILGSRSGQPFFISAWTASITFVIATFGSGS